MKIRKQYDNPEGRKFLEILLSDNIDNISTESVIKRFAGQYAVLIEMIDTGNTDIGFSVIQTQLTLKSSMMGK